MQVLDRTGVGTLWSICKAKFALAGHTHSSITDGTMTVYSMQNNEVNFGGSNNSATIYFGYRAKDSKPIPSNFIFGGSTGTATLTAAKFKGALEGNASTASNASTVNGHTVNANVPANAKFTDTNTWRGIQDNLTSTSTSESLSANQGKVLKGLVDGKANSSHTHTLGQITNAGAAAGKNIRTLNAVSHSSWSSASTDDLYVPTMSFIAYWNGAYNSSGNSNLQYCYKGKFGNLAVKDTADWSQVASKPATATRWPSWGEVTGKPELKSWSETKSYIDNKAASSGGVDSLPIGTELLSYNGNNIFGDKFVKEDGSFYKKTDIQFNAGEVHEVTVSLKDFNFNGYDTQSIAYFGGYYYMKKSGYHKWWRSTSLTGTFAYYSPLDGCNEYIGNGAFSGSYIAAKTVIIGGKTYNNMAYAYDGKYFLDRNGITVDFDSYINTGISQSNNYKRCKNNNRFLYQWLHDAESQGKLTIADLSTAKVIRSIRIKSLFISSVEYEEVCYDESKNMAVCVVGSSDGYWYVCIVHFSNNSINKIKIDNSNIGGENHVNLIGSTIIWANANDKFVTIYDYYANIYYNYKIPNTEYNYYDALIINNNLYASCFYSKSTGGHVNDRLIAITYPFDNHDSSKYYQIKNRRNLGDYFVKVK